MTKIIGAGGGGAQEQRTPVESPDSLVSIAYARIVDLIAEGEIYGLVDGKNSIYLDGTPVSSSGVDNFSNVIYEQKTGTQDQEYIKGFAQVESEISVGAEITIPTPYVRAVTNTDLSAIRVNFTVPRMFRQDLSNGDTLGSFASYAIDMAIGSGPFNLIKYGSFSGKTTGGYSRSERVDLPSDSPDGWRIRVRRLTPDSAVSTRVNAFYVQSVTEIIDAKFRYPNSALIATQFDAEAFGGKIPVRSFDMWGRYMRVPSNYDTVERTYTGIWDGTFKIAEKCNNPAWVYYDLLLNDFFGLGTRIGANQIDKWGLYQIAQYCDQMVDDGNGGLEPRFTINIYIQQRVDALKLLQDISSVFRGITYWASGQAYVSADMPVDPVYTYTNASVAGGKFSYRGSRLSTRYSVAHVSWNDPSDSYKTKTEYVENQDAVVRFGIKPVSMAAFGCTSQGQAIRAGKWALITNLLETESVSFTVGLDGIRARPGQVIRIADNDRAGRRIGGRITAATINSVTVDKTGEFYPGDQITIILPEMQAETRTILSIEGKLVTVSEEFTEIPLRMSVFAVDSEELATQTFRIISISEASELSYQVQAVKHVSGKYDNIDYGTVISSRPVTAIPTSTQQPVTGIEISSEYLIDQYAAVSVMNTKWTAPPGAVAYDVEWSRGDLNWVYAGRTSETELDVHGIYAGDYRVRVKAINSMGIVSVWATEGPVTLEGKPDNTAEVLNLRTESEIFAIRVRWGAPATATDMAYTELMYNITNNDTGATTLGQISYPTFEYLHSGMGAAVSLWFKARLIDKTGNTGPWSAWVQGISSADSTEILEYLVGQITETELGENLLSEIDKISGSGIGSVNERIAVVDGKVNALEDSTDAAIAGLQDQINNIAEAPDWTNTVAYLAGSLVNNGGRLYSAKIDVPIGIDILNTTYWEDIGAFSSLGEAVASLNVRMDDAETNIDEVTGIAVAATSSIEAMRSSFRDDNGEGELADALRGWDSQATFAQEVRTRATENEASVTRTTLLEARTAAAESRIVTVESTVVSNNTAITMRVDLLTADVGANSAAIASESIARADADTALASQITALTATVGSNTAAISSEATARANADGALSTQIGLVSATTDSNTAAILAEQTARSDADSALASDITNLEATVGDNTAAIEVNATTLAGLDGDLSAMYSIKLGIDVNGKYYGAGMGIGIENTPSGMQSQVLFLADRFAIMHATGGTPTAPFIVQGGQVIINNAVIGNATISFAKISDTLQSTNYVPGATGWRLAKDGGLELNGEIAGVGSTKIVGPTTIVRDGSGTMRVRLGVWA